MKPNKKMSAFAVFKGKNKGAYNVPQEEIAHATRTSDTNLQQNGSQSKLSSTSMKSLGNKKLSTSSTRSSRNTSGSEIRKRKADIKKIRHSSQHTARSYLPDEVLNSPVSDLNSLRLTSLKSSSASPPDLSMESSNFSAVFNSTKKNNSSLKSPPIVTPRQAKPPVPPKPKMKNVKSPSPQINSVTPTTKAKGKHIRTPTPPFILTPVPKLVQSTKESVTSPKHKLECNDINTVPRKKRKTGAKREKENMKKVEILPYMYDSNMEAAKLFECMIHPVKPEKFFSELWEKKPLLVKRHMRDYNEAWFSTAELDRILREENLQFSVNLDITTYQNGKRETHNPHGKAYAPVVWDYYQNGCSIRLLNPQTYCFNTWKMLSVLQEFFNCMVGANIYLTPPGSQGFAPHYDDIEAFVLQLEGKKHWRLYSPRNETESLPRYSSDNFGPSDDLGEPILDVVLEAGDLLYFPRGVIHQADTPDDAHSLHITVSTCQRNTWGDLLEKLLPSAVQLAFEEDTEFRKALPRDYVNYMGVANQDSNSPERTAFLRKIEQLMSKLLSHAPVDAACDQMAVQFIRDALPPVLSDAEKACSIHGNGEKWDPKKLQVVDAVEIEPDTAIKIIRKGAVRLVTEQDSVRVYHTLQNPRVYHGNELQHIEIAAEAAPAVEHLIHCYPEFCRVDDLPLDTVDERVEIASILYDKCLLVTGDPLEPHDPETSSSEDES